MPGVPYLLNVRRVGHYVMIFKLNSNKNDFLESLNNQSHNIRAIHKNVSCFSEICFCFQVSEIDPDLAIHSIKFPNPGSRRVSRVRSFSFTSSDGSGDNTGKTSED